MSERRVQLTPGPQPRTPAGPRPSLPSLEEVPRPECRDKRPAARPEQAQHSGLQQPSRGSIHAAARWVGLATALLKLTKELWSEGRLEAVAAAAPAAVEADPVPLRALLPLAVAFEQAVRDAVLLEAVGEVQATQAGADDEYWQRHRDRGGSGVPCAPAGEAAAQWPVGLDRLRAGIQHASEGSVGQIRICLKNRTQLQDTSSPPPVAR